MDTAAQWPQDIATKSMEEIIAGPKPCSSPLEQQISRKSRPQKEQALNCPRCNSTNTKFCYYNNYSLTQPRYFCKTCRRYWTEGGSLRNIPVGGGSRKNKRSSSSSTSSNRSSSSSSSKIKLPDLVVPQQNPNQNFVNNMLDHHQIQKQDLNLGFSIHHHHDFKAITDMIRVPNFDNKLELPNNPCSSSFMSFPIVTNADLNTVNYSSGFNFSLDGLGGNYGSFQGVEESNGKLLFPFEDLKQDDGDDNTRNGDDAQESRDAATNGFWNGVIGGGSW